MTGWYKHWSWHFKGFKDYGRKGHLDDNQKWLHLTKREKRASVASVTL